MDWEQLEIITNFSNACYDCQLESVKLLLTNNYEILKNHLNDGLYYACTYGYIELVKHLIEKGADDFNSGLHYALDNGHLEIAQLLINKGANNLNEELCVACIFNNLKVATLLINNGANDFQFVHMQMLIRLLNNMVNMDAHRDTTKLKEMRCVKMNYVKTYFDELKWHAWHNDLLTNLICEYIPYE